MANTHRYVIVWKSLTIFFCCPFLNDVKGRIRKKKKKRKPSVVSRNILSYISKCFPGVRDPRADTVSEKRISNRSSRPWADCRPCPARYRARATDCRSLLRDRSSSGRCCPRRYAGNAPAPSTDPPWPTALCTLISRATTSRNVPVAY